MEVFFQASEVKITSDDLLATLHDYVATIPVTDDEYVPGEVEIKLFDGIDLTYTNLLSCETLLLDVMLYIYAVQGRI